MNVGIFSKASIFILFSCCLVQCKDEPQFVTCEISEDQMSVVIEHAQRIYAEYSSHNERNASLAIRAAMVFECERQSVKKQRKEIP